MSTALYDIPLERLDGQSDHMMNYRGRTLLIVNVASHCGFTPQYAGLEALHETYQARGFAVLGFPCNQFGQQEPGSDAEIAGFCESTYGVRFPLFKKTEVNGPHTHPLYVWLKKEAKGLLGTESIKWNFTKFLVNSEGSVIHRFAPTDTPDSLRGDIEALLPLRS